MDSTNSLTEFFYNIVPGVLFVVALNYYSHPSMFNFLDSGMDAVIIFYLLISGLFFGFVFQGFTKFARSKLGVDSAIFEKVADEDESFATASRLLIDNEVLEINGSKKQIFYKMDSYLRGTGKARTLQHFTARLAFWSNMFFGTVIISFLAFSTRKYSELAWLLLLLIFSAWLFWEYLRILYDSVLKTFITVVKIEPINNRKSGNCT